MISVIIPTFNNGRILSKCLDALARQDYPLDRIEVIVIVDGSTDDTMERLERFSRASPFRLEYDRQENQGPGPARNNAIRRARGELLVILNDDLIPEVSLLRKHAEWHARHPRKELGVLGYVEEENYTGSDFTMIRLAKAFERAMSRSDGELGWEYFWTTNISLKREFFIESGEWFSRVFPHLALEDVEFGYRLYRRGFHLFMEPAARGLHNHPMTHETYMRRAYQTGVCLVEFYKLNPELKDYLVGQGMISAASKDLKPLRALVADVVINDWSVSLVDWAAMKLLGLGLRAPAVFLINRLFGYHQRRGIRDAFKRGTTRPLAWGEKLAA